MKYEINNKLSELLKEYPDAKIYTFTFFEVVCEDYGYWLGGIEKVYYGSWWEYEECIYLDYQDLLLTIQNDRNYDNESVILHKVIEHKGIIILIDI